LFELVELLLFPIDLAGDLPLYCHYYQSSTAPFLFIDLISLSAWTHVILGLAITPIVMIVIPDYYPSFIVSNFRSDLMSVS
jgi:hypothetical protein